MRLIVILCSFSDGLKVLGTLDRSDCNARPKFFLRRLCSGSISFHDVRSLKFPASRGGRVQVRRTALPSADFDEAALSDAAGAMVTGCSAGSSPSKQMGRPPFDMLDDGALTGVLERLDVEALLAMRFAYRRARQLASQPVLWRCVVWNLCALNLDLTRPMYRRARRLCCAAVGLPDLLDVVSHTLKTVFPAAADRLLSYLMMCPSVASVQLISFVRAGLRSTPCSARKCTHI